MCLSKVNKFNDVELSFTENKVKKAKAISYLWRDILTRFLGKFKTDLIFERVKASSLKKSFFNTLFLRTSPLVSQHTTYTWISRASGWQTERADCNYLKK